MSKRSMGASPADGRGSSRVRCALSECEAERSEVSA